MKPSLARALAVVVTAATVASSCGQGSVSSTASSEPESVAASEPVDETADIASPQTTTTIDPYSLADLQDAYTIDAPIDSSLLVKTAEYGDFLVDEFTCAELTRKGPIEALFCVEGGTPERRFALVAGNERVSLDEATEVTTISHTYALYRSVQMPGDPSLRAEIVGSDSLDTNLESFFNIDLTVLRTSTLMGDAIVLRRTLFGPSRSWNDLSIIGLNSYGSPRLVATHSGEGVGVYSDGRGVIVSGYRYGDDEPLCCPSYTDVFHFRPGRDGWTRSTMTFPVDAGKFPGAIDPFAEFTELKPIFEYSMPHATP